MPGITITDTPNSVVFDSAINEIFARKDEAMLRVLSRLLSQLENEARVDLTAVLAIYKALSREDRFQLILHPLFQNWWFKLLKLLKSQDRSQIEHWLQELNRFFVIPALKQEQGKQLHLHVSVTPAGEIRFPGHPWHINLGIVDRMTNASVSRLYCQGEMLHLTYQDRDYILHVSELLEGKTEQPLLCKRTVLTGTNMELDASDPWVIELLQQMNAEEALPPYPKRDLQAVIPVSAVLQESCNSIIELIEAVWPELRDEMENTVQLIIPISSKYMVGWTNVFFLGAIFIKAMPEDKLFMIERIIHEASHVRLYMLQTLAPLHSNAPTDLFVSALRRDPRPASGIYHGAFVYGRVIEFMLRAANVTGENMYLQRALEMRPSFEALLAVLFSQVKLTETGQRLMENMASRVNKLFATQQQIQEIPA